jgi:hypothetical protein
MHAGVTSRAAQRSFLALIAIALLGAQLGGSDTPQAPTLATDPGWPRQYSDEGGTLVVYQPQVESWKDFRRLEGRLAVSIKRAKSNNTIYGVIRVTANTLVNTESRTVALTDVTIADARYPNASDAATEKALEALTAKLFPGLPTTVSLERILAYMDTSQIKATQTAVSLDPPPILVSTQPAILVIIDGEPALFDIENTDLQKVVNTNWDLFYNKKEKRYYLRFDKSWLSARALTDAWKVEKKLPKGFTKLPDTDSYREVKQTAASPQRMATVVLVLVAHKPTELIVIDGPPALKPVPGTQLSWVANTESDLFFDSYRNYYFLTSGRWFRTSDLQGGKWVAATTSLPDDFKNIPLHHPRAHVLASVPGTRQAEEAVLTASIPKVATIDRKTPKAQVQYIGDPKFEGIKGTNVSYATNTPNDVLKVGDVYYLCLDGIWLVSTGPNGPWATSDKVPDEIYTIPAESPKHNVTYVSIYDSTPETVTYGYTSGYSGVYVGYGVAMWGTGYYYPPYYGWGYYPYPVYWPCAYYTYGASVWYNPATGAYARGSAVYGPYGGYGRAAAYNPATGAYAWGRSAWGPYGAAASGGFYNPRTGTWGGSYHASNGYQSWGQSVVGRGDQWARTASYSDSRGTIGGIQTSGGGKAIAARGSEGQGFVARSSAGDIYAGRDGNVYKRTQSGSWYKNSGGSWESVARATPQRATTGSSASREQIRSAAQTRSGSPASSSQAIQGLDRDAAARNLGNYNTRQSTSSRQMSSYSGARSSGYASRGGRRRR